MRLDAEMTLPERVGREMAAAASALLRSRPGDDVWSAAVSDACRGSWLGSPAGSAAGGLGVVPRSSSSPRPSNAGATDGTQVRAEARTESGRSGRHSLVHCRVVGLAGPAWPGPGPDCGGFPRRRPSGDALQLAAGAVRQLRAGSGGGHSPLSLRWCELAGPARAVLHPGRRHLPGPRAIRPFPPERRPG